MNIACLTVGAALLLVHQPEGVPPLKLERGAMLVYRGTYLEEAFPSNAGRREYAVTLRLLVAEADGDTLAVALASEFKPRDQGRSIFWVEFRTIDRLGRQLGKADPRARQPVDHLPRAEWGMLADLPAARTAPGQRWERVEADRPRWLFQVTGAEMQRGVRAYRVDGTQDEAAPGERRFPWTRRQSAWFHAADGHALRVEQVHGRARPGNQRGRLPLAARLLAGHSPYIPR